MDLMDGLSEDELLEDDAPTTHEAQASSTANQLDNDESGGGGGGGGNGGGPAGAPRNGVTSGGSDVGWMVEDGVPSGRSSNKNSIVTENKLFIGIPKEGATISPRHVAAAQEENEDEFGDDDPLFTCDKKTIMGLLAFCVRRPKSPLFRVCFVFFLAQHTTLCLLYIAACVKKRGVVTWFYLYTPTC